MTAGAGTLPKLYDAAALCVLDAGQQVAGDLRAALVISLCPVFDDGVREELATPRPDDVSAVLGTDRAEGQTRVKVAL